MSDIGTWMSDIGTRMSHIGTRMSHIGTQMSHIGTQMSDIVTRMLVPILNGFVYSMNLARARHTPDFLGGGLLHEFLY